MSIEIIHHSPYIHGNASEYIYPGGNIDITSHGMGSGIYGLNKDFFKNNAISNDSYRHTFVIHNPYVLKNEKMCDNYVAASKTIMRLLEKKTKNPTVRISIIATVFSILIDDDTFKKQSITEGLTVFYDRYHKEKDLVEMPINFILKNHGFDGVVSVNGVSCHSWSKGNVKFTKYPNESKSEVPIFLTREGIKRREISLINKGYALKDGFWVPVSRELPKNKSKVCRVCGSPNHKTMFCPQRKKLF